MNLTAGANLLLHAMLARAGRDFSKINDDLPKSGRDHEP